MPLSPTSTRLFAFSRARAPRAGITVAIVLAIASASGSGLAEVADPAAGVDGPAGAVVDVALVEPTLPGSVSSEPVWERAAEHTDDGFTWTLFQEVDATPGSPTFRVEARLDVPPPVAAETLMDSLSDPTPTTSGERRRLMERTEASALVHTYIDLPFIFSDRELAIRIEHTRDAATGVHRVEWKDVNEVLPPPDDDVLRLASVGFWEFHPDADGGTQAIYVSRAEVGGSLPKSIGDRMMRGQAGDAVKRLRRLVAMRRDVTGIDVGASGPPPESAKTQRTD